MALQQQVHWEVLQAKGYPWLAHPLLYLPGPLPFMLKTRVLSSRP